VDVGPSRSGKAEEHDDGAVEREPVVRGQPSDPSPELRSSLLDVLRSGCRGVPFDIGITVTLGIEHAGIEG
jgi:hypothetical protein